jgi:5-methylcytosine-specific restriction enzyme A
MNKYKICFGVPRDPKWPAKEKEHLKKEPKCRCCGSTKKLNVHHKIPYHIDKSKELDNDNLITLCMDHNCHFFIGHLLNWESYNENVEEDADKWLKKVENRPKMVAPPRTLSPLGV